MVQLWHDCWRRTKDPTQSVYWTYWSLSQPALEGIIYLLVCLCICPQLICYYQSYQPHSFADIDECTTCTICFCNDSQFWENPILLTVLYHNWLPTPQSSSPAGSFYKWPTTAPELLVFGNLHIVSPLLSSCMHAGDTSCPVLPCSPPTCFQTHLAEISHSRSPNLLCTWLQSHPGTCWRSLVSWSQLFYTLWHRPAFQIGLLFSGHRS